jgi:flagellar motility protein MotE (MotC chaperone)
MKTVIQLLFVMLLFGGASGGATFYWQKYQRELQSAIKRAEVSEAKANENPLDGLEKPTEAPPKNDSEPAEEKPEPPVAVRPPFAEGVDESSQLVVSLNQRLRTTHEKERRLEERQAAMQLIFADIRSEQAEINQLRQQLNEELGKSSQAVQDALKATQAERDQVRAEFGKSSQSADEALKSVQSERELLREELNSLRGTSTKTDPTKPNPSVPNSDVKAGDKATSTKPDSKPITPKRLGAIYDSMPTEVVADVLQQLTTQGRESVVVEILQSMKDTQAAKVLAAIATADPAKAATLTELLKR